ncbi:APC family permease [Citricoccus sp. CH26A]|uniref:APC family permease n=1 Tax=Citricoccus sp. CH26A TaxID=1045009 RepID=UPI0021007CD2|nr:APC family permease [Citricoccus sp. CH26A]
MSQPAPPSISASVPPVVVDSDAGVTARPRLRRNLGTASIVFIVVAAASPLGVIGGPVPLGIAGGNGIGFPFAYVVATVVLLLFAVGFTQMTGFVKTAGAFYSYVARGLGQGAGLGAAFVALLAYLALAAGVYGLIGPGIAALVTSYGGPEIPWWIGATVAFAAAGVLGFRNIEISGKVLAILLLAEVAIVLVLDAAVVFSGGGPEGFSTGIITPTQIVSGAPGVGILFAILSFVGFEATAVFRDEARDPERTIPRATYISLIGIGVFYAVSAWLLIGAIGDSRAVQAATEAPEPCCRTPRCSTSGRRADTSSSCSSSPAYSPASCPSTTSPPAISSSSEHAEYSAPGLAASTPGTWPRPPRPWPSRSSPASWSCSPS